MKKGIVPILICLLYAGTTAAQDRSLPRGFSEKEEQIIAAGVFEPASSIPGAITYRSPGSAPRSMAEWEEMQAIVITWTQYRPILAEIVRAAVDEVRVIIMTRNASNTRNYLSDRNIDPDYNIDYVTADFNSVWIRDYGGNPAYVNDVDSLVLVDWIYNRPRPDDDVIPAEVAEFLDVPLLSTTEAPFDLVNTGGNYMTDGLGRAFSSELVLDENGPGNIWGQSVHDEAAVDTIMRQFLGIDEYVKLTNLPFDGIHHIDMHMKVLDEQTILMGEYPDGVADGPQIEANLQYILENFKTATGKDYRIIRIPMPPDQFDRYPDEGGFYRTYANAMFVNGTILVPVYEEQYDTTALRIWQEAKPGHRIVGIDCNDIIPANGAIHCIVKEVGAHQPLWISHEQPLFVESGEQATISALIKHQSGINSANVYYRNVGDSVFTQQAMTRIGDYAWNTQLPVFEDGSDVEYYLSASAVDGKSANRPITAPVGFFRLEVGENTTGIENMQKTNLTSLTVFPNPASGITCIPVESIYSTEGRLDLFDLHGRHLENIHSGIFRPGVSRFFIQAGQYSSGTYLVKLTSEAGNQTIRLLIH